MRKSRRSPRLRETQYGRLSLRPGLSTIKNRKLRLMHELYPQVNIKLYTRSAVHKMLVKYGLDEEAAKIQGTEAQKQVS